MMQLKFHNVKTGKHGFSWPFQKPWATKLIAAAKKTPTYRTTDSLHLALTELVKPYKVISVNGLLDTITFPNEEEATAFLLKWM